MKRRDFIKAALAAGVTLTFPGNANMILSSLEAADKVDLAVAHGGSPAGITKAAIDA